MLDHKVRVRALDHKVRALAIRLYWLGHSTIRLGVRVRVGLGNRVGTQAFGLQVHHYIISV